VYRLVLPRPIAARKVRWIGGRKKGGRKRVQGWELGDEEEQWLEIGKEVKKLGRSFT